MRFLFLCFKLSSYTLQQMIANVGLTLMLVSSSLTFVADLFWEEGRTF